MEGETKVIYITPKIKVRETPESQGQKLFQEEVKAGDDINKKEKEK